MWILNMLVVSIILMGKKCFREWFSLIIIFFSDKFFCVVEKKVWVVGIVEIVVGKLCFVVFVIII